MEVLDHSLHSMSSDWTGFVNWEQLLTVVYGVVAVTGMLSI